MRTLGLLLGLLWLLPAPLFAAKLPAHQGYVTDQAGLLSSATEQALEKALREFEQSDSTQIAVLTVDSLEGASVEGYTLRVAEAWGIGQKGRDNGALLLVSKAERKVRIEVGYGLEGRLTDLLAGRIITQQMLPRFRQGDYDQGIAAGVEAMMQAVRGEYQGDGGRGRKKKSFNWLGLLFGLFFFAPRLLSHQLPATHRRSRRSGFWLGGPGGFGGGGGGFGGGFSGGGGGFGGGGASGGW